MRFEALEIHRNYPRWSSRDIRGAIEARRRERLKILRGHR